MVGRSVGKSLIHAAISSYTSIIEALMSLDKISSYFTWMASQWLVFRMVCGWKEQITLWVGLIYLISRPNPTRKKAHLESEVGPPDPR